MIRHVDNSHFWAWVAAEKAKMIERAADEMPQEDSELEAELRTVEAVVSEIKTSSAGARLATGYAEYRGGAK